MAGRKINYLVVEKSPNSVPFGSAPSNSEFRGMYSARELAALQSPKPAWKNLTRAQRVAAMTGNHRWSLERALSLRRRVVAAVPKGVVIAAGVGDCAMGSHWGSRLKARRGHPYDPYAPDAPYTLHRRTLQQRLALPRLIPDNHRHGPPFAHPDRIPSCSRRLRRPGRDPSGFRRPDHPPERHK